MKAIWIKDGLVENVSVWDDNSNEPPGYQIMLVEDDFFVGPGFKYENGQFIAPETPSE